MISDMHRGVCNSAITIIVAIVPKRISIALRKYPKFNIKWMEGGEHYRKTGKIICVVLQLINDSHN